ncbi:hypothetical protein [Cyanothece sp. BG0011]|uniref:hypothetical protein n=1 Tax=Cyanothece sp. BG0011 TaxID=2082950 RepID=UPI0018E599E2|nr:hypothetical protein [Cyanothece sp. BG0011]
MINQFLLNGFRGALLGTEIANENVGQKETLFDGKITHQKIIIDLLKTETISMETCQGIANQDSLISSGELILKILPLILFFHETKTLLSEQLEKIQKINQIPQSLIEDTLLFQQIIKFIFNQGQQPLINILTISPTGKNIEKLVNNKTQLSDLKKQFWKKSLLDSNYLVLSLYCFYRTPDNFKLSVLQASQFKNPVILGLTAVLSGAYNGYSGIPVSWRLNNKDNLRDQQIRQLWAKWTGMDEPLKTIRPIENQVINGLEVNQRQVLPKP